MIDAKSYWESFKQDELLDKLRNIEYAYNSLFYGEDVDGNLYPLYGWEYAEEKEECKQDYMNVYKECKRSGLTKAEIKDFVFCHCNTNLWHELEEKLK